MTTAARYIPERREIKALFQHLLERANRSDVGVNVAYVVNFSLGPNEPNMNVLIDPMDNWSRSQAKKVLEGVLNRLNEAEEAAETPKQPPEQLSATIHDHIAQS